MRTSSQRDETAQLSQTTLEYVCSLAAPQCGCKVQELVIEKLRATDSYLALSASFVSPRSLFCIGYHNGCIAPIFTLSLSCYNLPNFFQQV
jgi:hypothetical protein